MYLYDSLLCVMPVGVRGLLVTGVPIDCHGWPSSYPAYPLTGEANQCLMTIDQLHCTSPQVGQCDGGGCG